SSLLNLDVDNYDHCYNADYVSKEEDKPVYESFKESEFEEISREPCALPVEVDNTKNKDPLDDKDNEVNYEKESMVTSERNSTTVVVCNQHTTNIFHNDNSRHNLDIDNYDHCYNADYVGKEEDKPVY
ncbi:hypothetical protein BgiMline_033698, partial [Biomphalaria glabrata]|uniref:Uncharacterized protein n=1 Tax=Biomphalaria glabrata TaxID=6526 RepID=A0A2C9L724_BIOGL